MENVVLLAILQAITSTIENEDFRQIINYMKRTNEDNLFLLQDVSTSPESHTRIGGFCDHWLPGYLDIDFFKLFRMSRFTFQKLFQKVDCPEMHKAYSGGGIPIPAEKQLLMTLWWLGKGETLISVADRFDVAISTVHSYTSFLLVKLVNLRNQYIVWPDSIEAERIKNEFYERSSFPDVIGAIDVCNIKFKAPKERQESYIDRKMQHSIKLQAIVTAKRIFTNVMIGFPGSAHDSRVLRNSKIFNDVESGDRNYFHNEKYHIVGDSAYPLLSWLMTPYRDNGRNPREQHYNHCHSVTRIVVEHSFGILKSRWRILNFINVNSVEKAIQIIGACTVLHNFCYVNNDFWDTYEAVNEDDDVNRHDRVNINAVNKRNDIANNLM